jgi:putative restriction endonuclease
MDRNIIAPGPDMYWHVSRLIDPRRSTGEKALFVLKDQRLLLPQDPAFHPDTVGLNWRLKNLKS